MKTLGDRLKQRRQELGLTQVDIANRLGLTKATVSLWENGTNKPNGENFHTLAKTLKTSSEWLLSGKDSTADHDLSDGTGDRIRQLRKKAGLTQKELAKQVGVSAPAVTQWEGDEQLPKTDHAERLAMALKTNWQWIRYGEGQPTQSIAPTGRYEARRAALQNLIDELGRGGIKKVADAIDRSPSYVGRMLYPPGKKAARTITEGMAELITKAFPGWINGEAAVPVMESSEPIPLIHYSELDEFITTGKFTNSVPDQSTSKVIRMLAPSSGNIVAVTAHESDYSVSLGGWLGVDVRNATPEPGKNFLFSVIGIPRAGIVEDIKEGKASVNFINRINGQISSEIIEIPLASCKGRVFVIWSGGSLAL